jgi:hypothetical protein
VIPIKTFSPTILPTFAEMVHEETEEAVAVNEGQQWKEGSFPGQLRTRNYFPVQ